MVSATIMSSYNIMCASERTILILDVHDNNILFNKPKLLTRMNQHPPTWMDGALIGLSFLSLCHPKLTFVSLAFLSPNLNFCFTTLFSPCPLPQAFFPLIFFLFLFFSLLKLFPPTRLLTYIFKLKVDSSPFTSHL